MVEKSQNILTGEIPRFSPRLFPLCTLGVLFPSLFCRDDMPINRMEPRTYQRCELWTRSASLSTDEGHEILPLIGLNVDKEKCRGIRRSILLYLAEQCLFNQRHRDDHHHADADRDHDSGRLAPRTHDIAQGIAKAQDTRQRNPGQSSHECLSTDKENRDGQRNRSDKQKADGPRTGLPYRECAKSENDHSGCADIPSIGESPSCPPS